MAESESRRTTAPLTRALRALRARSERNERPERIDGPVRTAGLVLAAGASRRMGRPKALLRLRGATFVEHICDRLRTAGCTEVVVVVGAHASLIGPAVPGFARVVVNSRWRNGMRSSLRVGLRALSPGPVILTHVDRPWVAPETLTGLIGAHGPTAVVPHHAGHPGHPVRLPASLRARLLAGDDTPLHTVLLEAGQRALPVVDPGVLLNINTPADHRWLTTAVSRT